MINHRRNTYRIHRWVAGAGLAGGAAIAAALIGLGTAHGDTTGTTTTADLLDSASTNFTDANNVLSSVDVSGNSELSQFVANQTELQDKMLQLLGQLESSESTISSHDSFLSGTVDQLFFTPLDQKWVSDSDDVLVADQAFAYAVESGSTSSGGIVPADFIALLPAGADLQLPDLSFASDFVDVIAKLF